MVNNYLEFRQLACDTALSFLSEGSFLVHGYSRLVILLLKTLAQTTRFKVFVTQALPMDNGTRTVRELRDLNIMACLVSDSSIGYVMQHVDMVLVGAQVITQNGGIVNQMGTLQLAIVAKALNKPFYVLAESFKFLLMFPLDQDDLPIKMEPRFTNEEDNGQISVYCLI
jgi:translation initiation factor eIF-2B subunit alpha